MCLESRALRKELKSKFAMVAGQSRANAWLLCLAGTGLHCERLAESACHRWRETGALLLLWNGGPWKVRDLFSANPLLGHTPRYTDSIGSGVRARVRLLKACFQTLGVCTIDHESLQSLEFQVICAAAHTPGCATWHSSWSGFKTGSPEADTASLPVASVIPSYWRVGKKAGH